MAVTYLVCRYSRAYIILRWPGEVKNSTLSQGRGGDELRAYTLRFVNVEWDGSLGPACVQYTEDADTTT
jgi:hypothetical protein